jgi:hypothetical protein
MSTYTATTVPTQFVEANGILFAYRRWGKRSGLPLSLTYTHRADPNSSRVSNYSLTAGQRKSNRKAWGRREQT